MLPYIIFEFLQLLVFGGIISVTVVVMGVHAPNGVDISTTVAVAIIGIFVMVVFSYFWLCVVSLYQNLKEIKNYGTDQVKEELD